VESWNKLDKDSLKV